MEVAGEQLLQSPADVGTRPKTVSTYSSVTERTSTKAPYRIIIFFRKNSQSPNINLSDLQKGRLVYRKLNVPRGKCLLLDDSKPDRIILKIAGDVPVYTLHLSVSHKAKKGLWTKPVAPVTKPVKVSINGTGLDTRADTIKDFLKNFGNLSSRVTNQVYESKEDDDDDAKAMAGVMKSDREAWIKLKTHIPSAVIIENKKVVIKYNGQPRQCTRCLRKLHLCPAKGWPKMCEEIFNDKSRPDGVPRGDLPKMMDELMSKIMPRDESGGTEEGGIVVDFVDIEGVPEAMDLDQMHQFLVDNNILIDRSQVEKDEDIKTRWRVSGLLPAEVTAMKAYVNGRKLGGDKGKKIKVIPVKASSLTPAAAQKPAFAPEGTDAVRRSLDMDNDQAALDQGGEGSKVSPQPAAGGEASPNLNVKLNPKNVSKEHPGAVQGNDGDIPMNIVGSSVAEITPSNSFNEVMEVDQSDKTIPKPRTENVLSNSLMNEIAENPTVKKGSEEWNKVSPKTKKKKSSLNTQLIEAVEKVGRLGVDWAKAKNEAAAKNSRDNLGRLKTVKKEYLEAQEKVNLLKQRLKDQEIQEAAIKDMTDEERIKLAQEADRKQQEDLKRKSMKQDLAPEKSVEDDKADKAEGDGKGEDMGEEIEERERSPVQSREEVIRGSEPDDASRQARTSKRIKSQNKTLGVLDPNATKSLPKK